VASSVSSPAQAAAKGLVGQDQSFLDPIGHDEQAAEIRQREKLDVGVAESASNRDRLAEQRFTHLRVRF
jgi:hypothetical protein